MRAVHLANRVNHDVDFDGLIFFTPNRGLKVNVRLRLLSKTPPCRISRDDASLLLFFSRPLFEGPGSLRARVTVRKENTVQPVRKEKGI
jgi:hypothetical protein